MNPLARFFGWLVFSCSIASCSGMGRDTGTPCDECRGEADAASRDPVPDAVASFDKAAVIEIRLEPPYWQGAAPRMEISGGFVSADDASCSRETLSGCQLLTCTGKPRHEYEAPGQVAFTPFWGGRLAFDPGDRELSFVGDSVPWAPEEEVQFESAGEAAPIVLLSTRSPAAVDIGDDRELFINRLSRSERLEATWLPVNETVLLRLTQSQYDEEGNTQFWFSAECLAAGASGQGEVPAEVVGRLRVDPGDEYTADLETWSIREATTVEGDYNVTLRILRAWGGLMIRFGVDA